MNYEDIIQLPHPEAKKYPRMTMAQRAAQFNPFAALTGYEEEVEETGRYTEEERFLTEESIHEVNEALAELKIHLKEWPRAVICYFEPDERKNGGSYRLKSGRVRKIDELDGIVYMEDEEIAMSRIMSIETEFEGAGRADGV